MAKLTTHCSECNNPLPKPVDAKHRIVLCDPCMKLYDAWTKSDLRSACGECRGGMKPPCHCLTLTKMAQQLFGPGFNIELIVTK